MTDVPSGVSAPPAPPTLSLVAPLGRSPMRLLAALACSSALLVATLAPSVTTGASGPPVMRTASFAGARASPSRIAEAARSWNRPHSPSSAACWSGDGGVVRSGCSSSAK